MCMHVMSNIIYSLIEWYVLRKSDNNKVKPIPRVTKIRERF